MRRGSYFLCPDSNLTTLGHVVGKQVMIVFAADPYRWDLPLCLAVGQRRGLL